jgi:ferric-dicitrate binding protein FerR (iron transport regulator)
MNKNSKELLQRYLNEQASPEERQQVLQLIAEGNFNKEILDEAVREILAQESGQDMSKARSQQMLAHILSHDKKAKIIPIHKKRRWALAAAATVIIAIAGIWWTLDLHIPRDQSITSGISEDRLYSVAETQSKYVQLPDGSTVTLNKGSKLAYQELKEEGIREVILTGEAFFEVKPDPNKPFIVKCGNVSTRVLGTAFNVKSNSQQKEIIVTVTKGKVQVYSDEVALDVLTPNQQMAVQTSSREFRKIEVDAATALEWTTGFLILDHLTLEEAASLIELRYNVKIRFANQTLKKCRIMATFLNNETLEHVLTVVNAINQTQYVINSDGSIVIDGKGCD